MTTNQIDQMIYDYTVEHGGTPADLNYEGYPKSVCTSINDVVATVSPASGCAARGRYHQRGLLHDPGRLL